MKNFAVMTSLLLALIASSGCRSLISKNENKEPKNTGAKIAVWIDTDPSVAPGGHEVDDGFALIQAFHSSELEIRGVSAVFGNAELKDAFPIAQEIMRRFGPQGVEVHAGAFSAAQLGEETAASRALAQALVKEKLTVLALGPITNVATVLKNHPELGKRINEVIAVAGRRPDQRFTAGTKQSKPFRDFNFEMDPAGFQVLLDTNVPITLAPWEVSSKVWLKSSDLKRLESGNEATQWLFKPAADWLKLWQEKFGADGFNPFDTLAVAYVTSPQLIEWEELPVEIKILPDDVNQEKQPGGKSAEKPYLLVSKESLSKRKVRYCFSPSQEFKSDLISRLLKR